MELPCGVQSYGLTKRYGRIAAVDAVDLAVPAGAFYLLIGPNGAGKTTTFRLLLGITKPDAGHAEIGAVRAGIGAGHAEIGAGHAEIGAVRCGPDGAARAHIGFVPEQYSTPYAWLRVRHLIAHHSGYHRSWDAAYADRLVEQLEIRTEPKYGKLSKGQARRVQLLLALAHRPPLLLLDEPTDGLDPVARDTVQAVLAAHVAESPTTVIVATHLVYEMDRFADHIGVLRSGRLVRQVPRDQLHSQLRRYVLDVPADWQHQLERELPLLAENGTPRERRWTVWGEERDVTQRLAAAGATVRSVTPLTLDEAARALLSEKERK